MTILLGYKNPISSVISPLITVKEFTSEKLFVRCSKNPHGASAVNVSESPMQPAFPLYIASAEVNVPRKYTSENAPSSYFGLNT